MNGPYIHPATKDERALLAECDVRRQRRRGPGGQHRNKVETAVLLMHRPTGVAAEASERRSQAENRRVAVRRLRINLALHVRQAVKIESPPSEVWRTRCVGRRISVSPAHEDLPGLLAEALDTLAVAQWDLQAASQRLGCSASQLVKSLKLEPGAFTLLNRERVLRGLRPLR